MAILAKTGAEPFRCIGVGEVDRVVRDRAAAGRRDGGRGSRPPVGRPGVEVDILAARRKLPRNGLADAARSAGDERHWSRHSLASAISMPRAAATFRRIIIRWSAGTPMISATRQTMLSSNSCSVPSAKTISHIISTMRARPSSL